MKEKSSPARVWETHTPLSSHTTTFSYNEYTQHPSSTQELFGDPWEKEGLESVSQATFESNVILKICGATVNELKSTFFSM